MEPHAEHRKDAASSEVRLVFSFCPFCPFFFLFIFSRFVFLFLLFSSFFFFFLLLFCSHNTRVTRTRPRRGASEL